MWRKHVFLIFVVSSVWVHAVVGQEPPAKPKAKVELRWVEAKRIEGVTEDKGFQASCDPKEIMYLHKKPALVLTAAYVAKAPLSKHEIVFTAVTNVHYKVELHLTKEGRDKLAASYEGKEMRLLAVVVDGKMYGGIQRYEKDKSKPFVPAGCWADDIVPTVQYFMADEKAVAERLVDAVK